MRLPKYRAAFLTFTGHLSDEVAKWGQYGN